MVNEIGHSQIGELQGAFQIEGGWKYFLSGATEALFNVLTDPSETMDFQDANGSIFESMKQDFTVRFSFLKIKPIFTLNFFQVLAEQLVDKEREHVGNVSDGMGNLATGWC